MSVALIILAAGQGSRMNSALPKVLHPIAGAPMLHHAIAAGNTIKPDHVIVVAGVGADQVTASAKSFDATVQVVLQHEQLGTGHATAMTRETLKDFDGLAIVLFGDTPFISSNTLQALVQSSADVTVLGFEPVDPARYGRLIMNDDQLERIVEFKDATDAERAIGLCNSGVLAAPAPILFDLIEALNTDNAQGEYYLTDLIALARQAGYSVAGVQPISASEVEGINSRQQLAALERAYQLQLAEQLMASGTSLADPRRFDQRGTLSAGTDNFIDVNCLFEGSVTIGSGVSIGPNCHIIDSQIGDGVKINANTVIEHSTIGDRAILGPFARIRPGTQLGSNTKVGNFVETKKAIVGNGSKINHLSYVGDAELGENVNVGAGTITCNYDGVNKHKTEIGDNSFIGSNSTLIAPLSIGKEGFVAAGSTINSEVPLGNLAVGRGKQRNIAGWKRPTKNK